MNEEEIILNETKLSSETIFNGKVLELQLDRVRLPNGKDANREVIRHKGAVCIIPVCDDGQIIVERQFRYPINKVITEIPAGKLEPGEDPEDCARRELTEETGYYPHKLEFMGMMIGSPAILDERIYMYRASELEKRQTSFDEDEFLVIKKMPLDDLVKMVLKGEIEDAKTQIAVLKLAYGK